MHIRKPNRTQKVSIEVRIDIHTHSNRHEYNNATHPKNCSEACTCKYANKAESHYLTTNNPHRQT